MELSANINRLKSKVEKNKYLLLILVFFGIIYSLISFPNHYFFRTYALDLGLYTNALFKYGHFNFADSLMIKNFYESLLGGHFDLYLILLSPLHYLFGTYTLLILQIVFILIGSVGVFTFFKLQENDKPIIAYWAMIYFLLFFAVFSAVSYDFHSVVIASSLIPWFFYQFKKQNYLSSLLLLVFILISQENISLFMLFISVGLLFEYRKNKEALYVLLGFSSLSLLYFICVAHLIIPLFSINESYTGFLYTQLGKTPLDALQNIISNPFHFVRLLFENHSLNVKHNYIKMEMHLFLLFSGSYLLFLKPQYFIMLIPIYVQKFFHDLSGVWGVGGQYSIEFAPIFALGIFSVIHDFKNKPTKNALISMVMIGAIFTTIRSMDKTIEFTNKTNIRFYKIAHYQKNYNVSEVYKQINLIPADARVSAQSPFVPHLALRNYIYQFPIIKDAEYIIYSSKESPYPLKKEEFLAEITKLENSNLWKIIFKNEHLSVLKMAK